MKVVIKSLLVWLMIIPLAVINGLVRDCAMQPLLGMGLLWAGLAVVFESLLGLAMGRALADVLAAYDMASGNLWLLVVLCVGCAPWVAAKMRRLV